MFCSTRYILLGPGRASASNLGPEYGSVYKKSTIFLSVVWLVYPIIWGCAEGGNLITVTSEMIGKYKAAVYPRDKIADFV